MTADDAHARMKWSIELEGEHDLLPIEREKPLCHIYVSYTTEVSSSDKFSKLLVAI